MRFSAFLLAAIVPFTLAAPIVERDLQSISSSVDNIIAKINILSDTVTGFQQGQLLTALKIQVQTGDVGKAVDAGTKCAKASQPLNADDSLTLGIKILLELQPKLNGLLDLLVSKKPAFKNVLVLGLLDVSFLVKADLKEQKSKALQFADAVTAKLDPSLQGLAAQTSSQIAQKFDEAIAAFA
ncbi:uncharacterized protein K489DRAFT_376569 [Dissoconium aciculare CBS 342.82]|jgi:hypothetical protein|uniref:Uncharacterized protein n=1 Tax=Dissoconium aciculare CBS 342.82 TaxID=1314786 RepID=A0A6J3MGZ2_9PEZI|nr:uncharacterized protein K489DRAFT_376569 [Dissoconium aciculare CBS 342.82]KAF1826167.1 hypothetical protein K489DRAFT_376569 [Dissoconium aciculare CBS 342.82]